MHVLQRQLAPSDSWFDWHDTPHWIIEGPADWVTHHRRLVDDADAWNALLKTLAGRGPTLADAPYTVGAVASELLSREHWPGTMLECWRLVTAPDANTGRTNDWRQSIHQAFGEEYASFPARLHRLTRRFQLCWDSRLTRSRQTPSPIPAARGFDRIERVRTQARGIECGHHRYSSLIQKRFGTTIVSSGNDPSSNSSTSAFITSVVQR